MCGVASLSNVDCLVLVVDRGPDQKDKQFVTINVVVVVVVVGARSFFPCCHVY